MDVSVSDSETQRDVGQFDLKKALKAALGGGLSGAAGMSAC